MLIYMLLYKEDEGSEFVPLTVAETEEQVREYMVAYLQSKYLEHWMS